MEADCRVPRFWRECTCPRVHFTRIVKCPACTLKDSPPTSRPQLQPLCNKGPSIYASETMVRSVIPDSDDDSGGETSPYNFSSTIRPAEGAQQSPSARLTVPKSDNADTAAATTQDNAEAQLILGTGSTGMAHFVRDVL